MVEDGKERKMKDNTFQVLHKSPYPKVLVVTPLLPFHKVSKETKRSIKRNKTPFTWITSSGNNNIPTNLQKGLDWYDWYGHLPPYYIMIDNDIILGRHMIDRLFKKLSSQPPEIAFAYASFEFKGIMDRKFPAEPYSINKLSQHNYISSNSLFRSNVVRAIGLVTDDFYRRLLDWAFMLKLYRYGYYGIPCPEANFIAQSSQEDISVGSREDYGIKRGRVMRDFVVPLMKEREK